MNFLLPLFITTVLNDKIIHWSFLFHKSAPSNALRLQFLPLGSQGLQTSAISERRRGMPWRVTPQGHSTLYEVTRKRQTPPFEHPSQSSLNPHPKTTVCQTSGTPSLTGRPHQRQHKHEGSPPAGHPVLFRGKGRVSLFAGRDYMGKLQLPGLSEDCVITLSRAN